MLHLQFSAALDLENRDQHLYQKVESHKKVHHKIVFVYLNVKCPSLQLIF